MLCIRTLLHAVALLEAIDTSAGIHQLLFAGVEGMTFGTNINPQFLLGRSGFERLTAHAANDAFAVLGMDFFLHCSFTSFAYAMNGCAASHIITYLYYACKPIFLISENQISCGVRP